MSSSPFRLHDVVLFDEYDPLVTGQFLQFSPNDPLQLEAVDAADAVATPSPLQKAHRAAQVVSDWLEATFSQSTTTMLLDLTKPVVELLHGPNHAGRRTVAVLLNQQRAKV